YLPPRCQPARLSDEELKEQYPPALEEGAHQVLHRLAPLSRGCPADERPAAGICHPVECPAPPRAPPPPRPAAPVRREQQRPKSREAVRMHESGRHELPQRLFELGRKQPRTIEEIIEERRSVGGERVPH